MFAPFLVRQVQEQILGTARATASQPVPVRVEREAP